MTAVYLKKSSPACAHKGITSHAFIPNMPKMQLSFVEFFISCFPNKFIKVSYLIVHAILLTVAIP